MGGIVLSTQFYVHTRCCAARLPRNRCTNFVANRLLRPYDRGTSKATSHHSFQRTAARKLGQAALAKEVTKNDGQTAHSAGMYGGPPTGSTHSTDDQRGSRPRFARCTAPIRLRPSDLSSADQDPRYGFELRIEPLEMMTDFRDEPSRKIAVRLREWAALLNQAAASLER